LNAVFMLSVLHWAIAIVILAGLLWLVQLIVRVRAERNAPATFAKRTQAERVQDGTV
jgi:hypothetical protein